jgi:hypothetical protein
MVYIVDNVPYRTKTLLKAKTTSVINEMIERKISAITKESPYFNFWVSLLDRHPTKGNLNPTSFRFEKPCHMYFTVFDGEDSFSYNSCISQKQNKNLDYFACLRSSIEPQIQAFRESSTNECKICGKTGYYEVDHILTFKELYENFKHTVDGLNESDAKIYYDSKKHRQFFDLTDEYTRSLSELWVDYHRDNATFQKLCKICHKKIIK